MIERQVTVAAETQTVLVRRTYTTSIDDLWDACTNPERIPRWFLPVSGDLSVGGRYQLEGNAGGTIERCDPQRGFRVSWEYGGNVSWIEVKLTDDGEGRSQLELAHILSGDPDRWAEFGPGAVGVGWDLALRGLGLHLTSGRPVDRAVAMEWTMSDEGRRFITESSDRWSDANVAAGADPADARAAAARTTAFYAPTPTASRSAR